jgi:hypothetical protein
VRLEWKKLTKDKYSSLLGKSVIDGQKKFYNIAPRSSLIDRFGKTMQPSKLKSSAPMTLPKDSLVLPIVEELLTTLHSKAMLLALSANIKTGKTWVKTL